MDDEQKRLMEDLLGSERMRVGLGKGFFFGDVVGDHEYPEVPQEDQQKVRGFLTQVRHFADTVIDPVWIDRHAQIPKQVITGLAQMGLLGMTVPKAFGGMGMSQYAYCKATEIIAGRCGSTALFINAHQSIGLKALLLFGSKEQKERWLVPLARGEELAAFSLTEPTAGSDAAGIETRAVFDPVKNVYRITGKKQWTTNGSLAHVLTVMAKTTVDGQQDKITAFLVTPDMHGFHVTSPALDKVGMRGSQTANLEFCDMEVPATNVLGPVGGGLKVCLTVLDYGRTTFGAACTGAAKFMVKSALEQAKNRYQFKRPLAAFGLVKKKIARMGALAYAMDATTYLTAGLVDKGHGDIMLESAMLKVFASEALWEIIYDTMQIYGGRSFFTDHPHERMMRDARLNMIGEGSNEVMRAFIGAVGMRDVGLELKGVFEALKHPVKERCLLGKYVKQRLAHLCPPKIEVHSSKLKTESKQLAKAVKKLGVAVRKLLKHYREGIVDKQLELERIANSAIAIYTMFAVISKLDASFSRSSQFAIPAEEIAAGRLYCCMALDVIDSNLNTLFSKGDEAIESLSDQMTGLQRDIS